MTNKKWWQSIFESHPKADELPEPIFVEIPVDEPEKVPHVVHIPVAKKKLKRKLAMKKARGLSPKRKPAKRRR